MAKIYGQLEQAQLQNNAGNLSGNIVGRVFYNTSTSKVVVQTASLNTSLLANDQNCVFGTNGTANSNVRFNRAAAGVLQLVLGGDTTAEGSLSTSLAQLSFKFEGYATGSLPAAGSAGRVLFDSTLTALKLDTGAALLQLATLTGTETLTNKTLTSPSINTSATYANQAEVRFAEQTGNGTNYVGFKAADAVTTNLIWKLPDGDGANTQVMQTDGAGNLTWGNISGNIVVKTKTTTYSILITDGFIKGDTSGGGWTATLPTPVGNSGVRIFLKKITSDFNVWTIGTAAGSIFEQGTTASTTTLNTVDEEIEVCSDGTNWIVLRRYIPSYWVSFTPIWTGMTIGNGTSYGEWKRVGDSIITQMAFSAGSTTTYTGSSTTLKGAIPSGPTLDTSKLIYNRGAMGAGWATDGTTFYNLDVDVNNTTTLIFLPNASTNYVTSTIPFAWGTTAGTALQVTSFPLPVTGWKG